jgi:ATP-dependent DNA helicase RecG
MAFIDDILDKLATLIRENRYEQLETDAFEIKPVPAIGGEWRERHRSVNAFLNTHGGILLLGVKEQGTGKATRYVVKGWRPDAEARVREIPNLFTDRQGHTLDLTDCFPPPQIRTLLGMQVAFLFVDELSADKKFAFYEGCAYERHLTGDIKISARKIEAQEEFKEEAAHARELQIVPGTTLHDIDLDKLNDYIQRLNQPVRIETIKPSLKAAQPFLKNKSFMVGDSISTLGMLVCGKHLEDRLGFRCQVHGYVDVPDRVAQDKQDLIDNVLPLMEKSLAYLLRNIQVGVGVTRGGISMPEYPEQLLRETVNNALAHRDYTINKQCVILIKPGDHIAIQNPGTFRPQIIVDEEEQKIPIRRIIPEAKPRNPKLANVLRVFRKWEGLGIGMATLVNLCLEGKIDVPYYRFRTEEVRLHLPSGKLVDDRMERLFAAFDDFTDGMLDGKRLSEQQKSVLAYLIKSEWLNEQFFHTVLLTPDNNHFRELDALERAGLIEKARSSPPNYPVYLAHRTFMTKSYERKLRTIFGSSLDGLSALAIDILSVIYRFTRYSKTKYVSAKQASFYLWYEDSSHGNDIKAFDAFYRRVRSAFNLLERKGLLSKRKDKGRFGYALSAVGSRSDQGLRLFD